MTYLLVLARWRRWPARESLSPPAIVLGAGRSARCPGSATPAARPPAGSIARRCRCALGGGGLLRLRRPGGSGRSCPSPTSRRCWTSCCSCSATSCSTGAPTATTCTSTCCRSCWCWRRRPWRRASCSRVAFALYVVLATWTLILFHLRREMEENYLVKHSGQAPSQKVGVSRILNSRRVVGGSFLAATGAVALAVFAGAVGDLRAGAARRRRLRAGRRPRTTRNLVGFSDEVTLGTSRISCRPSNDDGGAARDRCPHRRACRLRPRARRRAGALYWRGTSTTRYDSGHWVARRTTSPAHPAAKRRPGPVWSYASRTTRRQGARQPTPAAERAAGRPARIRQEIDVVGVGGAGRLRAGSPDRASSCRSAQDRHAGRAAAGAALVGRGRAQRTVAAVD